MYKVLIVDDEALIRNGLRQAVVWNEMGFEVVETVGNSAQAREVLKSSEVDVLMTDIQMPGKTGLELATEAKVLRPKIRIVVISGYDRFDYAVTALRMQVDDYILKPLNPKVIESVFLSLKMKMDEECRKDCGKGESLNEERAFATESDADICSHSLLVKRVKRMIEEQYANPDFSLSGLADDLGFSYNYLSFVFSKKAGISMKFYLTFVRMEKAKELVSQRKHKINDIAKLVGYSNPRYFTDAFRNYYKVPPTKYQLRSSTSEARG
jgi:two-component system response regulator YesN